LGDFGLLWSQPPRWITNKEDKKVWFVPKDWKEEQHHVKWLTEKPWTTLFIDGNHENHDRIDALPQVEMFGSKVGKVNDSIYHLKRGEVYTISDRKFFCFGGADSTDKLQRKVGIDWWAREAPTYAEMDYGLENLEKHGNKVDYIISHNCPKNVATEFIHQKKEAWKKAAEKEQELSLSEKLDRDDIHEKAENRYRIKGKDPVSEYLEHICSIVEFKKLYYGHWHSDWSWEKYQLLYRTVLEIY